LGTITLTKLLAPFMLKRGKGHFVVVCGNSLIISYFGYGICIAMLYLEVRKYIMVVELAQKYFVTDFFY
jgi:hypothetical protein